MERVCQLQSVRQHSVIVGPIRTGHVPPSGYRRATPRVVTGTKTRRFLLFYQALCQSTGGLRSDVDYRGATLLGAPSAFRQNSVSSTPTASTWPTRSLSASRRASPPTGDLVVHRVPITAKFLCGFFDRASQFPDPDGHPPGRPRCQQRTLRTNRGVLFDERPNRTIGSRARPASFPPPQTNRPTERRQIHQHHAPIAVGPHPAPTTVTDRAGSAGPDHHHQRGSSPRSSIPTRSTPLRPTRFSHMRAGITSHRGPLNRTGFPGDSISWEIMESWED